MSKTVWTILLTELQTVRIVCGNKACQTIVEMPLERLAQGRWGKCSQCGSDFDPHRTDKDHIKQFAIAMRELQSLRTHVNLEFVVQEPTQPA